MAKKKETFKSKVKTKVRKIGRAIKKKAQDNKVPIIVGGLILGGLGAWYLTKEKNPTKCVVGTLTNETKTIECNAGGQLGKQTQKRSKTCQPDGTFILGDWENVGGCNIGPIQQGIIVSVRPIPLETDEINIVTTVLNEGTLSGTYIIIVRDCNGIEKDRSEEFTLAAGSSVTKTISSVDNNPIWNIFSLGDCFTVDLILKDTGEIVDQELRLNTPKQEGKITNVVTIPISDDEVSITVTVQNQGQVEGDYRVCILKCNNEPLALHAGCDPFRDAITGIGPFVNISSGGQHTFVIRSDWDFRWDINSLGNCFHVQLIEQDFGVVDERRNNSFPKPQGVFVGSPSSVITTDEVAISSVVKNNGTITGTFWTRMIRCSDNQVIIDSPKIDISPNSSETLRVNTGENSLQGGRYDIYDLNNCVYLELWEENQGRVAQTSQITLNCCKTYKQTGSTDNSFFIPTGGIEQCIIRDFVGDDELQVTVTVTNNCTCRSKFRVELWTIDTNTGFGERVVDRQEAIINPRSNGTFVVSSNWDMFWAVSLTDFEESHDCVFLIRVLNVNTGVEFGVVPRTKSTNCGARSPRYC